MSNLKKCLLAVVAICSLNNAYAGLMEFDKCQVNCASLGVATGDALPIVATLEFNNNADNTGVDFVLTNMLTDAFPSLSGNFIAELFFASEILASGITNESSNVWQYRQRASGFTIAALTFNFDVDFERREGEERVDDGNVASWTFLGITEDDVSIPAMVHFQNLPTPPGSVKVIVPEPGTAMLMLLGLLGLGAARRFSA